MSSGIIHPSVIIREEIIERLGLTVDRAAEMMAADPVELAAVIDGQLPISPDMAIRLSMGFGGTAAGWLYMQAEVDLDRAYRRIEDAHFANSDLGRDGSYAAE